MVKLRRHWLMVFAGMLAMWVQPTGATACAVCFGDPNSDMAKGAAAGVLAMVGIIYGVLMCFAGVTVFWIIRMKRSAAQDSAV